MNPILVLSFLLLAGPADPWQEIRLSITKDPYTSSDHVTLCRVRAVNHGSRSWPGRMLRFEARAVNRGVVVAERGRFGLVLEPYGSLETLIALPGRHDRLEVEPLASRETGGEREKKLRKPTSGPKRRGRRRKG